MTSGITSQSGSVDASDSLSSTLNMAAVELAVPSGASVSTLTAMAARSWSLVNKTGANISVSFTMSDSSIHEQIVSAYGSHSLSLEDSEPFITSFTVTGAVGMISNIVANWAT